MLREFQAIAQNLSDHSYQLEYFKKAYAESQVNFPLKHEAASRLPIKFLMSIEDTLRFITSQCEINRSRATSYAERTSNQIHLVSKLIPTKPRLADKPYQTFQLANQIEMRISRKTAYMTHKLSESMQRDSASMITIAAVTMLFLPGTFVAVRKSFQLCNLSNLRLVGPFNGVL